MARGSRDSQWLVIRRCIAIIRRVQRGPASWEELVEAVQRWVGADAYGPSEGVGLRRHLYKDLERLRNVLQVNIRTAPGTRTYVLNDAHIPLLDLPDADLEAIAWLRQAFDELSPNQDKVQPLLDHIISYLPLERQDYIEAQRQLLTVDLGRRDDNHILADVKRKLAEALSRRLRIEIAYLASSNETGQPNRHLIDPYEQFYHDGHYYLKGWCHQIHEPDGDVFKTEEYRPYRLDRITEIQILPHKLPPIPPKAKTYWVTYRVAATVARQGVSRHRWIDVTEITPHPDGSATIVGTTDNLFFVSQALMRYRHHCEVLGGPELLHDMRETVAKMAQIYLDSA